MITKKSYITGIAIIILTSSTLAEDRTGLYFKANVGANKIRNTKQQYHNDIPTSKSKSKISPVFNIAAGFYLNNFVRHDLSLSYYKANFKKSSYNFDVYNQDDGITYNCIFHLNRKSSIYSLMFNSYIDLPITDNSNFFFGGGIGIAQIKEKIKGKATANNVIVEKESLKSKNRRNFAYSLTTGVSLKVSDNTNFELTYSWQDFGETKYKDKDVTKNRYNGHSIMTGVRFDV